MSILGKGFSDTLGIELCDLETDPYETSDLAEEKPALVGELELRMER